MVNKAVLNRPNEIFTEREEQRKEIDARKTSGEKLKGFPKPFNQVADKAFHITFLHSFDKALPIKTHKVWVEAANNRRGYYKLVVCKKQYSAIDPIYEHCEICETKIAGKKQLPFDMYAFVGYVHNFEGEVFTPDESKPEVFYNINPVRLVQVRFGKGAGTINTLKEDVRAGLFNKVMYEQKRTRAGSASSISNHAFRLGVEALFLLPALSSWPHYSFHMASCIFRGNISPETTKQSSTSGITTTRNIPGTYVSTQVVKSRDFDSLILPPPIAPPMLQVDRNHTGLPCKGSTTRAHRTSPKPP